MKSSHSAKMTLQDIKTNPEASWFDPKKTSLYRLPLQCDQIRYSMFFWGGGIGATSAFKFIIPPIPTHGLKSL